MRFVALAPLLVVACTSTPRFARDAEREDSPASSALAASAAHIGKPSTWANATQSPNEAALERVAQRIVAQRARGLGSPDVDTVVAWLRESGEPHVRPRVVAATGQAPVGDDAIDREIASQRTPLTRVAVARAPLPHGGEVVAAVVLDALADLEPVPTRARTGEWLTFTAKLHVRAADAKLVVLGPRGVPRTVPTSFDRTTGIARARFALDRPGAFTVQLVGDLVEGPRPVLEARVFADVDPKSGDEGLPPVPGEDERADLATMIAALRAGESVPPLAHDERLDAIARAHAERMRDAKAVVHDLGEGDLRTRFAEASINAQLVAENVARGASVLHAHRAIYASPSHRLNLLRADYTHFGTGIARSDEGTVYVCEVFAAAW